MKRFYSTGEAARLCGLTPSTIRRWVSRGLIKAHRTPGGNIRILLEHLLDFLRECDMPMHFPALAPKGTLLVCVEDGEARREVLAAAGKWKHTLRTIPISSDASLAGAIEATQPDYIVFEARGDESDTDSCQEMRARLAPADVRIAVIGPEPERLNGHADVKATYEDAPDWGAKLLTELFEAAPSAAAGAEASRKTSNHTHKETLDRWSSRRERRRTDAGARDRANG
jgi:excisionase family DNA binding protein